MSKLAQIEAALKELNPAGFQRLCDSYLHARGYENINPIGLVIGADKVLQGTPDTLFSQPDGRYIFAEYSTQQAGLAGKFEDDITKCFNPEKTGIPVDRIREVILCHNFRLDAKEEHDLAEICRSHGVLLSIYGLGRIAHDLYQKYLGLAKDFLGIDVDTGQIVPVEQFITLYSKSVFATPLNTAFQFRNDEIEQALSLLESEDLVLIAGHAGVGKTRFALECCRRYTAAHPEAQVRCIYNRGADLFEDLRVHFSPPGHYVILVDDTNRVSGFKYILQLLHDQRDDQKIKIVATVRDYALDKAIEVTRDFSRVAPIELTALKEEEIKEIVRTQCNIYNPLYLERIIDIAQGNPRVAIMAASIAQRENTLQSIENVSTLYDEYFHSMREELGDFSDPTLLQVAGLIAFFRAVDRSNAELMGAISDAFGIDPNTFWRAAEHLHRVEAVDMYEEEVVRVSDQVLSTYLFYLSVFQERKLDFATLLECFFPRYRHKVIDAINPVLSAFDRKLVRERLGGYVDRAWSVMQQREDANDLWHLIDVFWFVKQTEALLYVRESIRSLQPEPRALSELTFATSSQTAPQASVLSILDNFRYAGEPERRIALTLLIDYLEKRPAELPLIIRMLTERFGINRHSSLYGFCVERSVVDVLWKRAQGGANELVSRVLLVISEAFLHTHFRTHESKSISTVTIYQFDVPDTEELLELRQTIWNRIFVLYSVPSLQEPVLELFQKHTQTELRSASRAVIAKEAAQVQTFFKTALDPKVYRHCVIVHNYLDMLERVGAETNEELRPYFTNEAFELSELLFDDRNNRRDLGWEEYNKLHQERLAVYTAGFNATDFEVFFTRCNEILSQSVRSHYEYQVQGRVGDILFNLVDCRKSFRTN
jgi:conflict system STAND superfamily ATPase